MDDALSLIPPASIALKIVGDMDPSMFRRAFYSQFAFLGLFIPFLPFLPESPCEYIHAVPNNPERQVAS